MMEIQKDKIYRDKHTGELVKIIIPDAIFIDDLEEVVVYGFLEKNTKLRCIVTWVEDFEKLFKEVNDDIGVIS